MAVLGGTGLLIGGNMYGATCAQIDVSWGAHLFVGMLAWITSICQHGSRRRLLNSPSHPPLLATAAGVMVTVGWGRVSANLNLVRINGGQFSCGYMRAFGQTHTWAVVVCSIIDGDSTMNRAPCVLRYITHTLLHNTQDRCVPPDRPEPGSCLGAGWNLR